MELTPAVVIAVAVVTVVVGFVFIRWGRGREAAAPLDVRREPPRSRPMTTIDASDAEALVPWLLDRVFEQTGVRADQDPLVRDRIAKAAGAAMESLRTHDSASINLPYLTADANGPNHFSIEFKRNPDSTFEET